MLGGSLIKQRVEAQNALFVENLELNLKKLPIEVQCKVKKLNFLSTTFDVCDNVEKAAQLKADIIFMLTEFIKDGYHPIFVGVNVGFYLSSESLSLDRLPVFKEIYEPTSSNLKSILPVFTLSAKAKPFYPSSESVEMVSTLNNRLSHSA